MSVILWIVPQRGRHGSFFPVVHSVCPVLAHRAVCASDLSFRLVVDAAAAYFRHRRSWSFGINQRFVPFAGAAASRTTCNLMLPLASIDYPRVNERNSR